MTEDFFDFEVFAARIGMKPDWVRRNTKSLPHHEYGRRIRFCDCCVDRFREKTRVNDPMRRTERSQAAGK